MSPEISQLRAIESSGLFEKVTQLCPGEVNCLFSFAWRSSSTRNWTSSGLPHCRHRCLRDFWLFWQHTTTCRFPADASTVGLESGKDLPHSLLPSVKCFGPTKLARWNKIRHDNMTNKITFSLPQANSIVSFYFHYAACNLVSWHLCEPKSHFPRTKIRLAGRCFEGPPHSCGRHECKFSILEAKFHNMKIYLAKYFR